MVTLIKSLLCIGPILEFNGSVEQIQKEHPALLIQVDLILQNLEAFKVLVTTYF